MPHVRMRELQLRARGAGGQSGIGSGGTAPDHIKGMVSSVRSALKEVHAVGPAAGSAKIAGALQRWLAGAGSPNPGRRGSATAAQNYIACVGKAAAWHSASSLIYRDWELKDQIAYTATDQLDVLTRVALTDAHGQYWGRLLLWDSPDVSAAAAELLASPVAEALEGRFGAGNVAGVEVWQLRTGQRHTVSAATAHASRPAVAALIAAM